MGSGPARGNGVGEVLELGRGLVKDNTGYDLKHLVIGSEGTLGLITEVTVRLTTPPGPLSVLVLALPAFPDVMKVLSTFERAVPVTAFEFFSELALQKVVARGDLNRPFPEPAPFYALIEFEGDGEAALEAFEHCLEAGEQWGYKPERGAGRAPVAAARGYLRDDLRLDAL